mgnify:CR=1 FL=1
MNSLSLNQMENVQGGRSSSRRRNSIPWQICAGAFIISCFGPIGLAIGGPTSIGCLFAGESIL